MHEPDAVQWPRLARVRQRQTTRAVVDVAVAVREQLDALGVGELVRPGMRIAVTAGSRGIAEISTILATVVARLRTCGAMPFVVPAMGSHGGATATGQTQVLQSLGITEASLSCPILSSLDVTQVGEAVQGIPVWVDRAAAEADGIVVVNRVKPHTDFVGDIESGLLKMMAVGLGKCAGAAAIHAHGVRLGLGAVVPSVGRVILERCRILFGLAIVENAGHGVARIVAVRPAQMEEMDRALLREAQGMMAHLPCSDLDVLIVDEMGKDISGTGMDSKVIGRIRIAGTPEPEQPRIRRVVVRDLTGPSHGNALGVGLADFVTRRLADKIDYAATYVNAVTSACPEQAYLPVVADTDREAIHYALSTSGAVVPAQCRLMRIHNTRDLEWLYVSERLLAELGEQSNVEVLGAAEPMRFDGAGRLL